MNLTTKEISNSQIPLGQVGNLISSSKVFTKQFLTKIAEKKKPFCTISFSGFDNIFRFEIIEIIYDHFSDEIIFKLEAENIFFIQLKMNGYWEFDEEQKFQFDDIDWSFEEINHSPTSAFLIETLKAIFCLSDVIKVTFSSIDYWFKVSVSASLDNISKILQIRQIAYKLMIIERAFDISLPFPRRILTSKEVEDISFCYLTIIDREFEWAVESYTFFPFATEENLNLLPSDNTPCQLTLPILNGTKVIFDNMINLGNFLMEFENALIKNYEEAKENLAKLNGQPVKMNIKSLDGKVKYIALNAPQLPKNPWNKKIQKLIELDEKFNSLFLEKYFNLAASTLEGLSAKQKKAITERPKLSIKGFD